MWRVDKKMTCKNSKCKRICKLCEHIIQDNVKPGNGIISIDPMCRASEHEEIDCVTGEKSTVYYPCKQLNSDGKCEYFKLNVELDKKNKLIKVLRKRLSENREIKNDSYNYYYNGHRDTLEDVLLENLIHMLENNAAEESPDFEHIYNGYCENGGREYENLYEGAYHFIIKEEGQFKKAIKRKIRMMSRNQLWIDIIILIALIFMVLAVSNM